MDAAKAAIVAKIAGLIAAELGLAPAECSTIEAATLLYCIGTLTFPDSILLKLRRLQSTKLPSIQMEPQEGAEFPHRHTSSSLRMAERMSLTRNERWDGEGWLGLSGETIPIESRIVAVAWAVDVLTMPRRRHSRKCLVQSVKQINSQSGALFDPDVVLAFNRVIRKDSIGSVS
jgi:response regulator RpfG family c-di-GMP phosphodiesterase